MANMSSQLQGAFKRGDYWYLLGDYITSIHMAEGREKFWPFGHFNCVCLWRIKYWPVV